jgi:very-short-patch-repair endonuclease
MKARLERRLTAQRLRQELTLPEILLWQRLKSRRLDGLHFRKQHPVGPYILDFYCEAFRLAVEVDGEMHAFDDRPERDARRDAWFADHGVRTFRIIARAVLADADHAARRILEFARAAPSGPLGHLPQRGRRETRESAPPLGELSRSD